MHRTTRRSILATITTAIGSLFVGPAQATAKQAERPLLRTEADLIEALGGVEAVADKTMATPNRVAGWIATDRFAGIPPGYHLRFYMAAQSLGYDVDVATVFGLDGTMIARLAEGGCHA